MAQFTTKMVNPPLFVCIVVNIVNLEKKKKKKKKKTKQKTQQKGE
jgi:hypothetical protein